MALELADLDRAETILDIGTGIGEPDSRRGILQNSQ
jgi:hypothetical protein